ncbi:MAG: prepilin-type N-terminal cleavage/methylation domain-containing protein [Puniceicoccales bacterium]|jgi:prepilin-type N-terminal cleavage/methylation domain-containing protein|nr:prepilin-type N-terminal cleavage/methylation domain-containing protein [Puniceicoccales bacterium]
MSRKNKLRFRGAFTLIELLTVIAIIGILAAAFFAIGKGVVAAQNTGRARGDITTMKQALEAFKKSYSEYPMISGGSSDSKAWQQALHDCLTGTKVLKRKDNQIQLLDYQSARNDTSKTAQKKSFLSEANIAVDDPNNQTTAVFVDPWSNPYEYRYATISGGSVSTQWERPDYLLICAGAEYNEPTTTADYFMGSMESDGKVPSNYFDDKYRADNITNWKLE